jgi:hypothetical protein
MVSISAASSCCHSRFAFVDVRLKSVVEGSMHPSLMPVDATDRKLREFGIYLSVCQGE